MNYYRSGPRKNGRDATRKDKSLGDNLYYLVISFFIQNLKDGVINYEYYF